MTVPCQWRKSSFSGEQTDCVELVNTLAAVRDSKNPACVLAVDVRSLVSMARDDRFTR